MFPPPWPAAYNWFSRERQLESVAKLRAVDFLQARAVGGGSLGACVRCTMARAPHFLQVWGQVVAASPDVLGVWWRQTVAAPPGPGTGVGQPDLALMAAPACMRRRSSAIHSTTPKLPSLPAKRSLPLPASATQVLPGHGRQCSFASVADREAQIDTLLAAEGRTTG